MQDCAAIETPPRRRIDVDAVPAVATKPVAASPSKIAAANATAAQTTAPAASPEDAVPLAELKPAHWPQVFRALPLSGVTRSMAGNSILSDVTGNRLTLTLDEHQATLFNDEHRQRIATALGAYFEVAIELIMQPGVVEAETPARQRQRLEREYQQAAQTAFREDPLVQEFMRQFAAEIQPGSIVPLHPFQW